MAKSDNADKKNGKIDDTDREILKILQEDSRLSLRAIEEKLPEGKKKSISTIKRKIEELEKNKVIEKFTIKINSEKLGIPNSICFFIECSLDRSLEEIAKDLSTLPELIIIHQVTGDFQLACFGRCESNAKIKALTEQISKIKGIRRIISHSILDTYKEEINVL